jgi:hypothetical protein
MADDRKKRDEEEGEEFPRRENEAGMSDMVRKIVTTGISAAFMTEESIRGFVSEMRLPKETLNLLLQGAGKSKEELMNRVGKEIVGIISKIDFVKEASRFVEEHKFKISAEVEVLKKDGSGKDS